MTARLITGAGLIALAAWIAPAQDDPEATCTEERLTFYYDARAQRDEGPAARARLVRRADSLIARWDATAPECAGRLREPQMYVLAMDQRYEDVIRRLEPYLADPTLRAEPRSRILLGNELALALLDVGRTRDAAQARYRAAGFAADSPGLIGINGLNNAAGIAQALGDRAAAEAYLRAAVERAGGDDIEDLGGDYVQSSVIGRTFVSLGNLVLEDIEAAGPGETRDLAVREMQVMADSALGRLGTERIRDLGIRASAFGLRALALAYEGRHTAAEAAAAQALAAARASGFSTPDAVHYALTVQGDVLERAGHRDRAREAHELARADAIRKENRENEAQSLERLGRLAERTGQWDRAADHYRTAIDRRESFRDRIGLDDWSALAFATMQDPYRGLVRTRLAQGQTAEAFVTLDQTRARYLRDLRDHLTVRERLTPETRALVDSLATELGALRTALLEAGEAAERARLTGQISALQTRIETVTAALRAEVEPVDIRALQRVLKADGRTLIAYLVDRDESAAFVVTADTIEAVYLDATPANIRDALRSTGGPWRDGSADPAFDLAALHRLYQLLVAPVADRVPTDRVVIVPDVEVATVPFAMLTTAPASDYRTAPYLLREWTLSTELSAALVAEPTTSEDHAVEILAFGRSAFSGDRSTWNGDDLVHVAREIDRVTDYVGSEVYLGDNATEERFAERAGAARVIHLASHAEADPTLPLYSRIALSPSDGRDGRDGTLHLYEVLEMPLDADLVVLSGCSTAGGGKRDGEGIVGLQYGMRAAGAGATIATLWAVADDATADLMDGFYDGLADGLGKDEALRQAQLTYLDDHDGLAASPFYWAAPVLSGSPSPVPLQAQPAWGLLAVLIGLGLATGLAWVAHRRLARA